MGFGQVLMSYSRHLEAVKSLSGDGRFYSAIGRFVAEFSYLEFVIKHRIALAIDLQENYGEQIISHDFAMLCTIAQSVMVRGRDEDQSTRLRTIIAKCRELNPSTGALFVDSDVSAAKAAVVLFTYRGKGLNRVGTTGRPYRV